MPGRIIVAPPGARQAMHRHAEPRLVLFLRGEMREGAFEGAACFASGDFLYRPAFFAHEDVAGVEGVHYTRLEVTPVAARRWRANFGWRPARGRVDLGAAPAGDDLPGIALPIDYASAGVTAMDAAAQALAADPSCRIADLAVRADMTPHQFTRAFARRFGVAPAVYRRQARLQRAIAMICEESASLARIAAETGFHDQSHLSKEVRRETGHTPRALRGLAAG